MKMFDIKNKRDDASPPGASSRSGMSKGVIVGVLGTLVVVGLLLTALVFSIVQPFESTSHSIDDLGGSSSYVADSYSGDSSSDVDVSTTDGGSDESVSMDDTETKRVYHGSADIETSTFDATWDAVHKLVSDNGGYFSEDELGIDEYGPSNEGSKFAFMCIHVPEAKFQAVIDSLGTLDNVVVVSQSVSSLDVTDAYTSLETTLSVAQSKLDALRDIQQSAQTMDERLTMLETVTDQEEVVASLQEQLENYDDAVTYSTLYLDISEVSASDMRSEAVAYGDKLGNSFMSGWERGLTFFGGILLVIAQNWLVLLVAIAIVAAVLRRRWVMAHRKANVDIEPKVPTVDVDASVVDETSEAPKE